MLGKLDISDSPKSSELLNPELTVLLAQDLGDFWVLLRPDTRAGYAYVVN